MATVWRWPPDRAATGTRTEGIFADSSPSRARERTSMPTSSRRSPRNSRPRKRFSTTFRFSHRARSWNTVAMPSRCAVAGEETETVSAPKPTVPASGRCTPERTFTRVDFPAPLSPTRATTCPAATSRSTSVSAATAPKDLLIPRRESSEPPGPP